MYTYPSTPTLRMFSTPGAMPGPACAAPSRWRCTSRISSACPRGCVSPFDAPRRTRRAGAPRSPYEGRQLRPMAALEAWLAAAGVTEGPVSHWLTRDDMRVVQARVAAAKLDPVLFGEDPLRTGLDTATTAMGKVPAGRARSCGTSSSRCSQTMSGTRKPLRITWRRNSRSPVLNGQTSGPHGDAACLVGSGRSFSVLHGRWLASTQTRCLGSSPHSLQLMSLIRENRSTARARRRSRSGRGEGQKDRSRSDGGRLPALRRR